MRYMVVRACRSDFAFGKLPKFSEIGNPKLLLAKAQECTTISSWIKLLFQNSKNSAVLNFRNFTWNNTVLEYLAKARKSKQNYRRGLRLHQRLIGMNALKFIRASSFNELLLFYNNYERTQHALEVWDIIPNGYKDTATFNNGMLTRIIIARKKSLNVGSPMLFHKSLLVKLKALHREMDDLGLKPNNVTYNLLLSAFIDYPDLDAALKIYHNMKRTISPSGYTFNYLFRIVKLHDEANCDYFYHYGKVRLMEILEYLESEFLSNKNLGFRNIAAFSALLQAHIALDSGQNKLNSLLQEMMHANIPANPQLCTILIEAALNYDDLVLAFRLLGRASALDQTNSDVFAHAVLLKWLVFHYGMENEVTQWIHQEALKRATGRSRNIIHSIWTNALFKDSNIKDQTEYVNSWFHESEAEASAEGEALVELSRVLTHTGCFSETVKLLRLLWRSSGPPSVPGEVFTLTLGAHARRNHRYTVSQLYYEMVDLLQKAEATGKPVSSKNGKPIKISFVACTVLNVLGRRGLGREILLFWQNDYFPLVKTMIERAWGPNNYISSNTIPLNWMDHNVISAAITALGRTRNPQLLHLFLKQYLALDTDNWEQVKKKVNSRTWDVIVTAWVRNGDYQEAIKMLEYHEFLDRWSFDTIKKIMLEDQWRSNISPADRKTLTSILSRMPKSTLESLDQNQREYYALPALIKAYKLGKLESKKPLRL